MASEVSVISGAKMSHFRKRHTQIDSKEGIATRIRDIWK